MTKPLAAVRLALCCCSTMSLLAAAAAAQQATDEIVLRGHLAPVLMGVFTPDGERAITASSDETAKLWDLQSRAEVRQYTGHTGPLFCLALSADGRTLVTGAQDNTLRVWDVPQTKPIYWLAGHGGAAAGLALSTDGRSIASVGVDKKLRLWDTTKLPTSIDVNSQPIDPAALSKQLAAHEHPATAVAYRNDGNLTATADDHGRVVFWSPYLDQPQGQVEGSPITALAFHSNNQQLFAAGNDGLIRIWQLPTPLPKQIEGIAAAIQHLVLVSNQPLAVIATSDQVTRVINLDTSAVVREFPKREKPVTAIALSPNNAVLAIAEEGGRVVLFNMANGEEQGAFSGHAGSVHSIQFHPDNQQIFTAGVDGTVRHWRIPVASVPMNGHTEPLSVLAGSHGGQWYVTGAADKTVRVWQAGGQPVRALAGHLQPITAVAVRTDDAQIASADAEGAIWLWNASSGAPEGTLWAPAAATTAMAYDRANGSLITGDEQGWLRRWQLPPIAPTLGNGHTQPIRSVATTPDGKWIVSGSQDQTVRVWNAENGQAVRTLDAPGGLGGVVSSVAISVDGARVAAVSEAGQLAIWNLADGALQQRRTGTGGAMFDVAFLQGGLQVATLEADQTLRLWQVPLAATENEADALPYQVVKLPDASTTTLIISSDGKWLYASGASKLVRGWPLADGKVANESPQCTLSVAQAPITDLAISRDGQRLAAASEDRNVYVWDAVALAGAPAGQNLPPVQTFTHATPIRSVAISDDATRLAAAGDDFTVHRWDLATGQLAERLRAHTQPVLAVSFVGASQRLVSAGQDNSLREWTPAVTQVTRASQDNAPQAITHLVACAGEVSCAALLKSGQNVLLWKSDGTPLPPLVPPAGGLQSLRASSDGTRLVTGNAQGQVNVWTVADGKLITTLEAGGSIVDAAFNRAAAEVAVADTQNRVRIFSLEPARLVEEISLAQPVTAVAWSADEQQLALIGSTPQGLVASRALRSLWGELPEGPAALALSPDGARIFVGNADGKIRQLLTANGVVERTLEGHADAITELMVAPNGQQLASASRDKTLRIWNAGDGSLLHTHEHPAPLTSVSVSPNSLRIASIAEDGIVRVFDAASGLPLEDFSGHEPVAARVRWLADSITLASASVDKTLRIRQSSAVRSFRAHETAVTDMVLYNGGAQTLSCSADGRVVMSDATSGQVVREFTGVAGAPRAIASRVDNQRIAVGTTDAKVFVWNAGNAELLQTLAVDGPVRAIAWSVDNQKLAVSTESNKLFIFGPPLPAQPGSELVEHQQTATESPATRLVFDRDNRTIWASHASGHLAQWSYAAPTQIRQFNHGGPVYGVTISRDGKTIVSCSVDQTVRVWDNTTGQQRFQMNGHVGAVHAVALSPDESFAVSSGADRTLRLWDVVGGRQLKQLATLDETMYSVVVHPNGQLVAAAGADRKVYLFDLITGAIVRTLEGHTDFIHCVAFNAAGTRLLSYGYAGQLRIWEPTAGQLLLEQPIGRIGNYANYNADGSRILFSNGDGTARVFEVPPPAK
ncbi:MAG: WD40 repeat domain-containing protein [Planctomycetota bacterium]|nr:WD40 repeat domain-containing protein [Planctomycetota bacterium]